MTQRPATPRLQVALDALDLPGALGPLQKAAPHVDIIECGTILVLVSRLRFLGASPAAVNRGGTTKWAGFNSIDNEVLLAALRFGWAPVALFLVGLAVVVGRVLVRRGNAAQVALTALTPAYVTVAFITQLDSVVWIILGMAVAAKAATT